MTAAAQHPRLSWWPLSNQRSAKVGALIWLGAVLFVRPMPFETEWAFAILAFAALVLVPLALGVVSQLAADRKLHRWWKLLETVQFPTALLFAAALCMQRSPIAAALALPWLGTVLTVAWLGLRSIADRDKLTAESVGIGGGMVMLLVGAVWAIFDRYGWRPLDFEPVIVLLTAIHFHYAGFALPILAGLACRGEQSNVGWWRVGLTILSVPAVAVGITASQLGFPPAIETVAAWLMSVAGILVSWRYWRLAWQTPKQSMTRVLWRVAAISLAFGMVLAAMYGSRHFVDMRWLDIPWMRALHGTANAYGFAFCALLGWCGDRPSDR